MSQMSSCGESVAHPKLDEVRQQGHPFHLMHAADDARPNVSEFEEAERFDIERQDPSEAGTRIAKCVPQPEGRGADVDPLRPSACRRL